MTGAVGVGGVGGVATVVVVGTAATAAAADAIVQKWVAGCIPATHTCEEGAT